MKIRLPKLSRFARPSFDRRFFTIAAILVISMLIGAGSFFVYYRPDSATARRFARILPFPAAFAGLSTVWSNEVFSQQAFTATYVAKTNQNAPELPEMRSQILDRLIEVRFVNRAAARYKLSIGKDEIESAFETIAQQNGGKEQILSTLKELYGMGEGDFKALMADQILIDKFKKEALVTVSVRHILIKDKGKADALAKQAKEGGDFAQIAKEQSEDTGSRDAGGSLGFIGRGTTVKPFEDTAFALEPGQISDPIQSEFGWHIILVEERKGAIDKSYEDWLAETKNNTRIIKLLKR